MVKLISLLMINFLTNMRYKINFVSFSIALFLPSIPILLMLLLNDVDQPFGFISIKEYLQYVFIGIIFWGFVENLWGFVFYLRRQMREGIFEETLLMPLSCFEMIVGWSIDGLFSTLLQSIPMILVSIIIFSHTVPIQSIIIVFFILLISLFGSFSLSILFAGMMLVYKDSDQIVSFLGNVVPFICGLYLPISNVPLIFRYVSYIFPFTWGLDLIRYYFFGTSTILAINWEWPTFIFLVISYYIFGKYIYQYLSQKARKLYSFIGY